MRLTEDAVWRYYNCPDPFWSAKCRACRERIDSHGVPVEECLNCWKVEMWSADPGAFDRVIDGLLVRGIPVIAKASRAPILVVRSGIPLTAYPPEQVDYLLILYARDIAERDLLRLEAEAVLLESAAPEFNPPESARIGSAKTESMPAARTTERSLPIRRGCWKYDDILGPWQAWYPADRDYPQA